MKGNQVFFYWLCIRMSIYLHFVLDFRCNLWENNFCKSFEICNLHLQVLDFVLFCILYLVISGIVVYSSLMVALRPLFSYCSKENSSWKFLSFSKLWTPLDISEVALACFDTFFSWEFGLSDDLMNFYIIKTLLFKI